MQLSTGSTIGYTYLPSSSKGKQGYPIVYLHGGPGGAVSKRVIDDLKPLNDDGFGLYFYDQVGSGTSSRLNDISEYTVQRHVDDLDELIRKIHSGKVDINWTVMGFNISCCILYQSTPKESTR